MTTKFKVMDTYTLIECNRIAIKDNQNRTLTKKFIDLLDDDGIHVVNFTMDHKNYEGTLGVRCQIFCKLKDQKGPTMVWLDIRHEQFNALPTVETEDKKTA